MENSTAGAKSYPECEKLAAVKDQSQCVGEFLEWLQAKKGVAFQLLTENVVLSIAYTPIKKPVKSFPKPTVPVDKEDFKTFSMKLMKDTDAIGLLKGWSDEDIISEMFSNDDPGDYGGIENISIDRDSLVIMGADESEVKLPFHYTMETLLAEFFEIDLKVVEEERRAMLEDLRNGQ